MVSNYGSTYDEVAEARANAASEVPTIKPPSTGEPVPAAKSEPDTQPDTPTEVVEEAPSAASVAVAEQIPAANESAPIENAAEVTNSTTEPAHNG